MIRRKGINAINAILSFTAQSATASDAQSGASGPNPSNGSTSDAQDTSVAGWINDNVLEKAIEKKIAVSIVLPIKVEIRGARHHAPFRNVVKIDTSISCATRNAMAEPIAIRRVTNGPNSPRICVPINEQMRPTTKPTRTTRRAAEQWAFRFI